MWRFGLEEASRCISDAALESGVYYHKDAGIFTTSLSKPTATEVELWCDASHSSGSKPAQATSISGSSHCVVCRTPSAAVTGACKFCGADVATGISVGDEADLITLTDDASDIDNSDVVVELAAKGQSSPWQPFFLTFFKWCVRAGVADCNPRSKGGRGG